MKTQLKKIWGIPILLTISIFLGLLAALLGTGFWWFLSWVGLVIPLAIIMRFVVKKKKT